MIPLRPTQPYFAFDTRRFRQEVSAQQGISHFYTFQLDEGRLLRTVPDGCINIIFEYAYGKMHAYACGTRLAYSEAVYDRDAEVFGVCFMPGMQPELLKVTMRELVNHKLPLEDVLRGDQDWLGDMAREKDFYRRIQIFSEHHIREEQQHVRTNGKTELAQSVKRLAYDTGGRVKVQEMQEQTGYTARYLNKVFSDEMGFSPKTFCKLIQFQCALELLSCGADDKMTDVAAALGYYDQPQFIRDFTRYAGITPSRYRRLARLMDCGGEG